MRHLHIIVIACILAACATPKKTQSSHFTNKPHSSAAPIQLASAYRVKVIDFCELSFIKPATSHLIFLGDGINQLGGWNHIAKPKFITEFAGVSQGQNAKAYSHKKPLTTLIPKEESKNLAAHPACKAQKALPITLVKKYGHNVHKHPNGIQNTLTQATYGNLDKIKLYVKFDSAASSIPTFNTLKSRYGNILNNEQLHKIYDPNLSLKLTLSATNTKDANDLIGDLIVQVNPNYIDEWLLVEVDVAKMFFYSGQWFRRTPKLLANHLKTPVTKFKITAEAYGTETNPQKQGQTVKSLSASDESTWQTLGLKELYKELSMTIARIEITTK